MARYNTYIQRIEIDLVSGLIYIRLDDDRKTYCDPGELAEILLQSDLLWEQRQGGKDDFA